MKKNAIIIIAIILALLVAGFFFFNKPNKTGTVIQNVEVVPLSQEERQAVVSIVSETELIKDLPKNDPVALIFFDFDTGEKRFRDGFLINNNGLISEGEPTVYVYLHSKYIQEFNQKGLCEIAAEAKKNGDLGYYSDRNRAILLIKYSGMLKYRDCLGL